MPALLRAARTTYGSAVQEALSDAGCDGAEYVAHTRATLASLIEAHHDTGGRDADEPGGALGSRARPAAPPH